MTACAGSAGKPAVVDVCPGCGTPMGEVAGVTVYCDASGHPVHLLRICAQCANLFESGSSEARMGLFDRIGEIESVFLVCPVREKEMAIH